MIEGTAGRWDLGGVAPMRGEDRMLLDEANHRAANEVAAALAAIRLALGANNCRMRRAMVANAIDRLEGYGECCRLLAATPGGIVDAGAMLERVCRAMVRSRVSGGPRRVVLNMTGVLVPGERARRICLVAHKLVTNALKHAFVRGGDLEVRLERQVDELVLSVIDDGPGLGPGRHSRTSGTRLGGGIVGELVRSVNGSLECDSGPGGTAIHVMLPLRPAAPTVGTHHE